MPIKYYLYVGVMVALVGLTITVNLQHKSIKLLKVQNEQLSSHIVSINKSLASLEELRDLLGDVTTKTIVIEKQIRDLPDDGLEEEANTLSKSIFERF